MRIFIAFNANQDIKEKIFKSIEPLQSLPADVKWVKKDSYHITLKFLGEISEKKIPAIKANLETALSKFGCFDVEYKNIGFFPNESFPKAIWLGVSSGNDRIKELAMRIDESLAGLGFAREKREFSGHLTLVRVKSNGNAAELARNMKLLNAEFGMQKVETIDIVKSRLTPEGPEYISLGSISI